ncbi:hypothetical protein [Actinokineospora sp.]|uniref:hypothetical protein n=1 Tax=Actinokineospora sp. TaxID=1872133 RepID=UPI0040382167
MPIRTNRGRAAVYRKLWGWPLRSPKHLAVAVVVAAVLIAGVGILLPKIAGRSAGAQTAAPGSSSSAQATTTTKPSGPRPDPGPGGNNTPSALPTRLPSESRAPTSVPAASKALETAEVWARAWVDHPAGEPAEKWLDRLRPFTTEEYMTVMSTVDPANVAATAVTGKAVARASFPKSVDAEVPTNGGILRITVIETDRGWRVANYEQGA